MPRTAPAQLAQNKQLVLTKAVVNTANYLDIPKGKLAHILGVSSATVTRLYVNSYRLSPDNPLYAKVHVRHFRTIISKDGHKWIII